MATKTSDFKAPPTLNKDIPYATWKKELKIWEAFTSIEKKRAPAIFLTLTGQARETVLEFDIDTELAVDDGVKNLTTALDALYLQDESCLAYDLHVGLWSFRKIC